MTDPSPSRFHVDLLVCAAIIVMVVVFYGLRLPAMTVRGEESRRATVAKEMYWTGDYVVPRQQGDFYFMSARPPLQNWMMIGTGLILGDIDAMAIRLPSVIAIALTALLIYAYTRSLLPPVGAWAAPVVYLTFGQVLELGRLGETDAVFTLFVAGSMLLWHLGLRCGWHPALTWGSGWLMVAGGIMTKGPQAPVYFVAVTGVYLLATRQWRFALNRWNFIGAAAALGIVCLWLVPFSQQMGLRGIRHVFTGDVALYVTDWRVSHVIEHLLKYPLEVFGSLLPWSLLLVALFRSAVRRGVRSQWDRLLFPVVCLAVTFPTLWLVPGARNRFFMPLYPLAAILIAWLIAWLATNETCRRYWLDTCRLFAIGMVGFAGVVAVTSIAMPQTPVIGQPPVFAALVVLTLVGLAVLSWWWANWTPRFAVFNVLAIAAFTGIIWVGLVTTNKIRTGNDTAEEVAQLKFDLPPATDLKSLGPIPHLFAYYYDEPIPMLPPNADVPPGTVVALDDEPPFPFATLAQIDISTKAGNPDDDVIIALRLPPAMPGKSP